MRPISISLVLSALAISAQAVNIPSSLDFSPKLARRGFIENLIRAIAGTKAASPNEPAPPIPPSGPASHGGCPAIWSKVANNLVGQFSSGGQCNDLARAAIRAAFHDCGTWDRSMGNSAGCDGSLYLAGEYTRSENAGLETAVPQLGQLAQQFGVGVADFFQFAAATAVLVCPLGPKVQTFVGRKDRSTPNPEGLLPSATASGDAIVSLMEAKGISPAELSALIGAHTSAKQFAFDKSKAGAALDTTPGIWDVDFYGQTIDGTAPFILPSDIALANNSQTGPSFHSFVGNQFGWDLAFAPAMTKMSLFGVDTNGLVDCTSALPNSRFLAGRRAIGRKPADA